MREVYSETLGFLQRYITDNVKSRYTGFVYVGCAYYVLGNAINRIKGVTHEYGPMDKFREEFKDHPRMVTLGGTLAHHQRVLLEEGTFDWISKMEAELRNTVNLNEDTVLYNATDVIKCKFRIRGVIDSRMECLNAVNSPQRKVV